MALTEAQLVELKKNPAVRRLRSMRSLMTQIDSLINDHRRPEKYNISPDRLRNRIDEQFDKGVLTPQDNIDLRNYLDALLAVLGRK